MREKESKVSIRTLVMVVWGAIFSLLIFSGLQGDWQSAWNSSLIHVYAGERPFGDIENVTYYNTTVRSGLDPRLEGLVLKDGRVVPRFNYPEVWTVLPALGIEGKHTWIVGTTFFLLFGIALYCLLANSLTSKNWWCYCFALFSPAVFLSIERGNNDQFAFFGIVMAVLFLGRHYFTSLFFFLLATLSKLFPLAACCIYFPVKKRGKIYALGIIFAVLIAYLLCEWKELKMISDATPVGSIFIAYGWKVIQARYYETVGLEFVRYGLDIAQVVIFIFLCAVSFKYQPVDITRLNTDSKDVAFFKAGAAIYVFTYLLGTSFDYRLIFLILCFPFLLHNVHDQNIYKLILGLCLFLLWSFTLAKYGAHIFVRLKQLAHYSLFLLFLNLLIGSVVKSTLNMIPRSFSKSGSYGFMSK